MSTKLPQENDMDIQTYFPPTIKIYEEDDR